MSLAIFPPEVLAIILNDDLSWATIELYKCGNLILNHKLEHGGIQFMRLEDSNASSPSRWPKCLASFQLLRLTIQRPSGPLCSHATLHHELKRLHHGLKELEIDSIGASDAIFPPFGEDEWDLNLSFPQLQVLRVRSPSHPKYLDDRLFSRLPRSLIHFELYGALNAKDLQDFDSLPPGLKTLHIQPITKSNVRLLPDTLTSIGEVVYDSALLLLARDPSILPNLEFYPWEAEEGVYTPLIQWFLEGNIWPPHTRRILVSQESEALAFQNLPRDLTWLYVGSSHGYDFSYDSSDELPSKLVTLKLGTVDWTDIEASIWPTTLTDFDLGCDEGFSFEYFSRLPRTLKKLSVNSSTALKLPINESDSIDTDIPLLLRIGRETLQEEDFDADLWLQLKPSLGSAYIKAVESGWLSGLPLGLVEFELGACICCGDFDLILPPVIRQFAVTANVLPGSQRFFSLLPCSLTSLHLPSDSQECKMEAIQLPTAESYFPLLKITSLRLGANFPPILAFYLPQTLRHLSIKAFDVKCELLHIAALPRHLETLTFHCNSTSAGTFWCAHLPASLKVLDVWFTIDGKALEMLPPLLTELTAPLLDVSLHHLIHSMPRRLQRLNVTSAEQSPSASKALALSDWSLLCNSYIPFRRIYDFSEEDIALELHELQNPQAVVEDAEVDDGDEDSGSEVNTGDAASEDDNDDDDDAAEYAQDDLGEKDSHARPVAVQDIDPRILRRFALNPKTQAT